MEQKMGNKQGINKDDRLEREVEQTKENIDFGDKILSKEEEQRDEKDEAEELAKLKKYLKQKKRVKSE